VVPDYNSPPVQEQPKQIQQAPRLRDLRDLLKSWVRVQKSLKRVSPNRWL
jgi:hypothetical protein